jgi:hypothetical protein
MQVLIIVVVLSMALTPGLAELGKLAGGKGCCGCSRHCACVCVCMCVCVRAYMCVAALLIR